MFVYDHMPVEPMRITSPYGPRNTGIKGATTYHHGIDIGANRSLPETPIYAVKDGIIHTNSFNPVRGNLVLIRHNNAYMTLYQHLKHPCPIPEGYNVKAGEVIGIMGNSSKTLKIATHLHFELWEYGKPIDPEIYLKGDVLNKMTEQELRKIIREELSGKDKGTPPYASEAWKWAVDKGLVDGTGPQGYVTRAMMATVLNRLYKEDK